MEKSLMEKSHELPVERSSEETARQIALLKENIPDELKKFDQFVVWRFEKREGSEKPAKVPIRIVPGGFRDPKTGERIVLEYASTKKCTHWGYFEEALERFRADPTLSGIGFVFTEDDPYCGVDLDNIIDGSGNFQDWAKEAIEKAGTYAEISPSGKGVKMIGKARPRFTGTRRGQVEIYRTLRFFTLTGQKLDWVPPAISEIQECVDWLVETHRLEESETPVEVSKGIPEVEADPAIIEKLLKGPFGRYFKILIERFTEEDLPIDLPRKDGGELDLSAIDWYRIRIILTATRDPAQIKAILYRYDVLWRPKWEEKRGSGTWLDYSITRALAKPSGKLKRTPVIAGDPWEKEELTMAELLTMELPPVTFYVDGLLTSGMTVLCGYAKAGKSYLALEIVTAVAKEGLALDHFKTLKSDVLYISMELNRSQLMTMLKKMKPELAKNVRFRFNWKRLDAEGGGLDMLDKYLSVHPETKLVIIDPLAPAWAEGKRRSGQNVYHQDYQFVLGIKKVADKHEAAIVGVHHFAKPGKNQPKDPLLQVSGSTGITGAADMVWTLDRTRFKDTAIVSIMGRCIEEAQYTIKYREGKYGWQWAGDGAHVGETLRQHKILACFKDEEEVLTVEEISKRTGYDVLDLYKPLQRMTSARALYRVEKGQYKLPFSHSVVEFHGKGASL